MAGAAEGDADGIAEGMADGIGEAEGITDAAGLGAGVALFMEESAWQPASRAAASIPDKTTAVNLCIIAINLPFHPAGRSPPRREFCGIVFSCTARRHTPSGGYNLVSAAAAAPPLRPRAAGFAPTIRLPGAKGKPGFLPPPRCPDGWFRVQ